MPDTVREGPVEAGPAPAAWGPPRPPPPPEEAVSSVPSVSWDLRRVISMIGVILLGAWGWGAAVDRASVVVTAGTNRLGTVALGVIGLVVLLGWSVVTSMLFARRKDRRAWRLVGRAWLAFLVLAAIAWPMTKLREGREGADREEAVEGLQDLGLTESDADDLLSDLVPELEAAGVDPVELALSDDTDGFVSSIELDAARAILRVEARMLPGLENFDEAVWSDADIRRITAQACAIAGQATSGLDFEQQLLELWSADTIETYVHKSAVAGAGMNYACDNEFDRLIESRLNQLP